MVAVIKTGKSLSRILNYNEHKVKEGVAEGLGAFNYLLDMDRLTFSQKLNRLTRQAALNDKVTSNSFHVSLNFDKSDKLSKPKLLAIAESYMTKIGFGGQPYLVYQHNDAGHPHIHIVSLRVRADGSRIDVHNLGRNQSEKARKQIEQDFNLVKAEGHGLGKKETLRPMPVRAAEYGKKETKEAIASVLNAILPQFNYTSLPELNAVLGLYNIVADRGQKDSRIHQKGGLIYRILDKNGKAKGVPIKASDFSFQPTLKNLETRFAANSQKRLQLAVMLRERINQVLNYEKTKTSADLVAGLWKQQIMVVSRTAKTGQIYGLTYVDLRNKVVCNGSELGKGYSAAGIMTRMSPQINQTTGSQNLMLETALRWLLEPIEGMLSQTLNGIQDKLLVDLLRPEEIKNTDFEFKKRLKKRRGQRL